DGTSLSRCGRAHSPAACVGAIRTRPTGCDTPDRQYRQLRSLRAGRRSRRRMAPATAKSIGEHSEQLALRHLQAAGLKLVTRNFRCRVGEVDLVMLEGNCLVMVEVRCRATCAGMGTRFPSALESVGPQKQRKLARAAL